MVVIVRTTLAGSRGLMRISIWPGSWAWSSSLPPGGGDPVMTTTGRPGRRARICRMSSAPPSCGMHRSVRSTSAGSCLSASSARRPLCVTVTRYPALSRASWSAITARASSSAMMMCTEGGTARSIEKRHRRRIGPRPCLGSPHRDAPQPTAQWRGRCSLTTPRRPDVAAARRAIDGG